MESRRVHWHASTINTSTAGTYSVTVTDTKGCTGSGSGTLTANPNPTVSVNSPEVCASTLPATLTATPAGGTGAATFAWSPGATRSEEPRVRDGGRTRGGPHH